LNGNKKQQPETLQRHRLLGEHRWPGELAAGRCPHDVTHYLCWWPRTPRSTWDEAGIGARKVGRPVVSGPYFVLVYISQTRSALVADDRKFEPAGGGRRNLSLLKDLYLGCLESW